MVVVELVMSNLIAAVVVVGAGVVVVALVVSSTGEDGEGVPMDGCCVLAFTVICAASVVVGKDGFPKRVDSGVEARICAKVGFVTTPTVVEATVVVVTGADEVWVTPNVGKAEEAGVVVKSVRTLGCCDVIVDKGDTGADGSADEKPKSFPPLNPSVVAGGKAGKATESDGAQHDPK